jgi:hypothetical protein
MAMSACSAPIIPAISRSAIPKRWLDCCSGSKAIAGSSRRFAARSRGGRRCSDRNARSRRGGGCLPNFRHNPDRRFGAGCRNRPANDRVMFVIEARSATQRLERSSDVCGHQLDPSAVQVETGGTLSPGPAMDWKTAIVSRFVVERGVGSLCHRHRTRNLKS